MTADVTPAGVLRLQPYPGRYAFTLRGSAAASVDLIEPAAGVKLPPRRHFTPEHPFRLKILHFNDLHGHICRFTDHGEIPIFARMVSRMNQLRRQAWQRDDMGVLIMSAGDDLVGSVFDELLTANEAPLHVSYHLYSAAGVDVATLGNHDFDMGPAALAQAIARDARFPLLSANLHCCEPLQSQIAPAAIFLVKGVRVGVIGLTTPGEINKQWADDFQLGNPVQAVHNILPALQPFCDVIIILSHLGYSLSSHAATVLYAGDVELARNLPRGGVQLIVGGHTHHSLNLHGLEPENIVNDIPIAQAGYLGEFLGEVDITLRSAPAVTSARLIRTALLPVDADFRQRQITPLERLATPILTRRLGRTANHPDLDADCVLNDLAAGESALANFIADALVARCRRHEHQVDLAFIDATSLRTGIPVDAELTFGDWFNVMPFADVIRLCWLTGEQLLALVQDNARRVDLPGEPHMERGFLHFSRQLRYRIELGATRSKIQAVDITFGGAPLETMAHRVFIAAYASFVREPALAWQKSVNRTESLSFFDIAQLPTATTGLFLRRELTAYISKHGGVTEAAGAKRDGRLSITQSHSQQVLSL